MNIDEIRKNRPEGATHYNDSCGWVVYARITSYNIVETFVDDNWYSSRLHISECELKPL